ncbi:MAG: hypothetical protein OXH93_12960 [Caldilineaceae bacterium]|nr:hypothetical protein [Caldilineaceae bacterium]
MKLTGKDRISSLALAAVMLSYFIWGFRGSGPLILLAFIPTILLVLSFAVPSKYQPHLITSIILLMAGVLVGVALEKLFGDIPYIWWAVYTWSVIAVALGVLRPFPLLERYFSSLKMTAARDAGKKERREKWKKYRPWILSTLTYGIASTVGVGILYLFSLYGPDVYGSRGLFEHLRPVDYVLIWWIVSALFELRLGLFKHICQKTERAAQREKSCPTA